MIREICITLLIVLSLIPSLTDAYRYSGSYIHGSPYPSRSTHWVKSYTTKNGVYHSGHLSGNPGSGVHCHENVCN